MLCPRVTSGLTNLARYGIEGGDLWKRESDALNKSKKTEVALGSHC